MHHKKLLQRHIPHRRILTVLNQLLSPTPCIVEAGAFDGTDTMRMAQAWPNAKIYAFEPLPEAFSLLQNTVLGQENISTFPYALDTKSGTTTFYVSQSPLKPKQPFKAGTLCKPTGRLQWSNIEYRTTITIPTHRLDEWMKEQAISYIDLLWLDVQGHALAILQSSIEVLNKINYLYVELEYKAAYETSVPLEYALLWLEKKGFVECGRSFTDTSTWFYGNILFKNINFEGKS